LFISANVNGLGVGVGVGVLVGRGVGVGVGVTNRCKFFETNVTAGRNIDQPLKPESRHTPRRVHIPNTTIPMTTLSSLMRSIDFF